VDKVSVFLSHHLYEMRSVQRSRRAFWSYTAQIQVQEVLKVRIVSSNKVLKFGVL
jgi:hypothetical protein